MTENSPAFQRRASIVNCISPEGTADRKLIKYEFIRPFGTGLYLTLNPALKRWAIFRMSLRDKEFGALREFPKGIILNHSSAGTASVSIGHLDSSVDERRIEEVPRPELLAAAFGWLDVHDQVRSMHRLDGGEEALAAGQLAEPHFARSAAFGPRKLERVSLAVFGIQQEHPFHAADEKLLRRVGVPLHG